MIVAASDDSEEESEPSERGTANSGSDARIPRKVRRRNRVDRQKLIIILVGLPGRGKTFLCNKLMCYLNWCAEPHISSAAYLDSASDLSVLPASHAQQYNLVAVLSQECRS